jgi:hypothetical protein
MYSGINALRRSTATDHVRKTTLFFLQCQRPRRGASRPRADAAGQALRGFFRYPRPGLDELGAIAERLHGHPYLANLASVVLEESPASEVVERLYSRIETRDFIPRRLLARIRLTDREQVFLELASLLRVPVTSEAFSRFAGPPASALLSDLLDRFLLLSDGRTFKLHPVLTEFFSPGLQDATYIKKLRGVGPGLDRS